MHLQKYIHTSPRKLRLVADMVRKMSPLQAVTVLQFTPKAAAIDLMKAVKTAIANAKQKGMPAEGLIFGKLEVNESLKMRRYRAGTRGRAKPFKKKMAHIRIVLTDQSVKESAPIKVKPEAPKKSRIAKKETK